jgi:2-polyprenyl-3-methyl-5-hydroxy-6-metoxy-1,4-benzoquinol methylase
MGYDLEYISDCYIFINNMVMEETYYFVKNGTYRYSTFKEVDETVYDNPAYMSRYMCGQTISDYIWSNHISMIRFYVEILKDSEGRYSDVWGQKSCLRYLEIGPGFGQYLIRSINSKRFGECIACDVSQTSADSCRKFLSYRGMDSKCEVINKNFFDYTNDDKFGFIVMGEVLEHVEDPLGMLKQIYTLLESDGHAYITTVINAPTIDHIYLFETIKDVLEMVSKAGFQIMEYRCFTAGNISMEKAVKKRQAIEIALLLQK